MTLLTLISVYGGRVVSVKNILLYSSMLRNFKNQRRINMYEKVTHIEVRCDCCGRKMSSGSHPYYDSPLQFIDTDQADVCMEDSEWLNLNGKHYCPDCYHVGGNNEYITTKGQKYRWNSVEDSLPDPEEEVIVAYRERGGEWGYCFTHRSDNPEVLTDKYGFAFYVKDCEISYWAYMLKPPKTKK